MKKLYQITAEGKKALEDELAALKSRRPLIAQKIADARGYGDLSENSEYDAARDEQGLVETRIAEIEEILANADLMKPKNKSRVTLGSKVSLKNGNKTVEYTVVSPVEANPLAGKVSDKSPIGLSIFGKKVDEDVVIATPKGEVKYKIVGIS